jgi:hypothetical protein
MASPDISESDVMIACAFSALTVTPVTPGIAKISALTRPSQCPQVIPFTLTVFSAISYSFI